MQGNSLLHILTLAQCFLAVRGYHSPPVPGVLGLDSELKARFELLRGHENVSQLENRASGQACGIQNGNTSCPSGQCCSAQGQCGTGHAFCDAPDCQFRYGPACDSNMIPQGANTTSIPRPGLGSIRYADAGSVTNCTKPGYVALTYDDGPSEYTSELLDILKKNKVPATFFITGNNFGKRPIDQASTGYPAIIQRMINEGHQIGSHTWSHQDLNAIPSRDRYDQMVKNEMAFINILGYWPTYMRPPYNSCQDVTGCRADMGKLGYHLIQYNVEAFDYVNLTPDRYPLSQNNVTQLMKGGNPTKSDYIIYTHDTHPMTVRNLTQWMIDTIRGQGYRFATVGDCLDDARTNWYRDPTSGQGTAGTVIKSANASSIGNTTSSSSSSLGASTSGSATRTASSATASATKTSGADSARAYLSGLAMVPLGLAMVIS